MSIPKAGAKIRAADLAGIFPNDTDGWISYTPTWSGTTAPSVGNGSLTGAYFKVGRLVVFRIGLTMGSTTTYGSGAWTWTLPTTPVAANLPAGQMRIIDASPSAQYMRHMFMNGSNVIAGIGDAASSFVQPTVPITFATGDVITIAGYYESTT